MNRYASLPLDASPGAPEISTMTLNGPESVYFVDYRALPTGLLSHVTKYVT